MNNKNQTNLKNLKIPINQTILPKNKLKQICATHAHIWVGIINLSSQSFSKNYNNQDTFNEALVHIKNGALILDVGAVPTNPAVQNALIDSKEELNILQMYLRKLKQIIPNHILISVDTYSPYVAYFLAREGLIDIVNDVCGGDRFENITIEKENYKKFQSFSMMDVVGKFSLGYILMHMFGVPESLPTDFNAYSPEECALIILQYFENKKKNLKNKNIDFCIFDPGIGAGRFGKTKAQNLELISESFLSKLSKLGCPILIGISRKSFIQEMHPHLHTPESRDQISEQLEHMCLKHGAQFIRSHVVKSVVGCKNGVLN